MLSGQCRSVAVTYCALLSPGRYVDSIPFFRVVREVGRSEVIRRDAWRADRRLRARPEKIAGIDDGRWVGLASKSCNPSCALSPNLNLAPPSAGHLFASSSLDRLSAMHRRHVAFLAQTRTLDAHLQGVSVTLRRAAPPQTRLRPNRRTAIATEAPLQPDPGHPSLQPTEKPNQGLRLARRLRLVHDLAGAIHHAHAALFQCTSMPAKYSMTVLQ
jgi:hypothetical protein